MIYMDMEKELYDLAKNVSAWPEDSFCGAWLSRSQGSDLKTGFFGWPEDLQPQYTKAFTKNEWLQARKDLGLEPTAISEADEEECLQLAYERMSKTNESTSDGSTASYYELPEGCTELQDLISYRNLNHCDGVLFTLCYDHAMAKTDAEKLIIAKEMVFHAEHEIRRLEGMHKM